MEEMSIELVFHAVPREPASMGGTCGDRAWWMVRNRNDILDLAYQGHRADLYSALGTESSSKNCV